MDDATNKLPRWVLADLKRSTLGVDTDAARLHIEYVPPEEMRALMAVGLKTETRSPPAAYRLPYFNANGTVNGFARYRFETPYKPPNAKKPQRYTQLAGSSPSFYLAPYIDWKAVFADPKREIWFTEGEKKAAALCKIGVACIGLGGVWNFTAGGDPIPDWNQAKWDHRKTVIVFDSDGAFKSQVQLASKALRKEIINRGASPYRITLPTLRGMDKTGVDDFLKARGQKALLELPHESLLVPDGITADTLMLKKFPKAAWIVEGLIPPGLTMVAGPPKIGKSFFVLQTVLAVGTGDLLFGRKTWTGEVLYLALEDSQERLQGRIETLAKYGAQASRNVHLHTKWPRIEEDGVLALNRWLDQHPTCRIVFIDTLAKMRVKPSGSGNLYLEDYEAMGIFKTVADERRIAVVVVYHTRKAKDEDLLNTISGSTGLTGAGDTYAILNRPRNNAEGTLFVTGRDIVEEQELAVRYEGGAWSVLGPAAEHHMSQERRVVVDALKVHGAMGATDLANLLDKKRSAVARLLLKLAADGYVLHAEGGKYALPTFDGTRVKY